jgi:hypothetical protein
MQVTMGKRQQSTKINVNVLVLGLRQEITEYSDTFNLVQI